MSTFWDTKNEYNFKANDYIEIFINIYRSDKKGINWKVEWINVNENKLFLPLLSRESTYLSNDMNSILMNHFDEIDSNWRKITIEYTLKICPEGLINYVSGIPQLKLLLYCEFKFIKIFIFIADFLSFDFQVAINKFLFV